MRPLARSGAALSGLYDHDPGKPLVVGEGIETAASAGVLMGFPAWAAISAGNMAKGLLLPPEARQVGHRGGPGRRRSTRPRETPGFDGVHEGRTVQIATPDGPGDFNDLLLTRDNRHG